MRIARRARSCNSTGVGNRRHARFGATSGSIGVEEAKGSSAGIAALGCGVGDDAAGVVAAAVALVGAVLAIAGMPGFGAASGGIGAEAKGSRAALGGRLVAAAVADTGAVPLLEELAAVVCGVAEHAKNAACAARAAAAFCPALLA